MRESLLLLMGTRASVVVLAALGAVLGCNRHPVGPAPDAAERPSCGLDTTPSSAVLADAEVPIGAAGGIFRGAGAQIIVPPGALAKDTAFKITRVTGDALADWPRGTKLGFAFEPANERFRVPVTLKLPHPEGDGEVVCQSSDGDRLTLPVRRHGRSSLPPLRHRAPCAARSTRRST